MYECLWWERLLYVCGEFCTYMCVMGECVVGEVAVCGVMYIIYVSDRVCVYENVHVHVFMMGEVAVCMWYGLYFCMCDRGV